jgi:cytochrome P450
MHLVRIHDHVSLCNLAKKYGGLMLLRLGSVPYLVVSSPSAAKAITRTHDHQMASLPASSVADAILYGTSDLFFSPYGEQWRQIRKLVATHLLSVKRVQSYRIARQQEVCVCV